MINLFSKLYFKIFSNNFFKDCKDVKSAVFFCHEQKLHTVLVQKYKIKIFVVLGTQVGWPDLLWDKKIDQKLT